MYEVNFDISGQVAVITGAAGIICGVMATEKGTGETVVVDPPVIDGMPQLFYKVETIQKQD